MPKKERSLWNIIGTCQNTSPLVITWLTLPHLTIYGLYTYIYIYICTYPSWKHSCLAWWNTPTCKSWWTWWTWHDHQLSINPHFGCSSLHFSWLNHVKSPVLLMNYRTLGLLPASDTFARRGKTSTAWRVTSLRPGGPKVTMVVKTVFFLCGLFNCRSCASHWMRKCVQSGDLPSGKLT